MHPQLEILLQIQDLKMQRRELAEAEEQRQVQEEEFNLDVDEAVDTLDRKIADMEDQLDPTIKGQYERIRSGRGRPVVPVINGTCYGCFTAIPTAVASDTDSNEKVRNCEHCGRFVYVLA